MNYALIGGYVFGFFALLVLAGAIMLFKREHELGVGLIVVGAVYPAILIGLSIIGALSSFLSFALVFIGLLGVSCVVIRLLEQKFPKRSVNHQLV